MLEIEFVIRGEKVRPLDVRSRLERAILMEVEKSLQQRVGTLVCSEHDAAPRITASGPTAEDLSFDLSGCCQDLVDRTVQKLS